jgi:hypothetical protein
MIEDDCDWFWVSHKREVGFVIVFIVTLLLMGTGFFDPFLNTEWTPPDSDFPWWIFFFLWR